MLKTAIVLCGLAALAAGCGSASAEGGAAPDFKLVDLEGKDVSLSSYRGKTVLLTFWAVG
jgi:cytochrome oxidase Cu insertion factor (SCO1/SenC/PrrC family)